MKAIAYLVILTMTSSFVFADDDCGGCKGKKKKGEEKPQLVAQVLPGSLS